MNFKNPFGKGVTVASTSTRPAKFVDPIMELTVSKNRIKLYEEASRLLQIQTGEYLAFITNDDASVWGICKGWERRDANGEPVIGTERMTGEEYVMHVGSKVAANKKLTGIGKIVDCVDATNYPKMCKAFGGKLDSKGKLKEPLLFKVAEEPVFIEDYTDEEGNVINGVKDHNGEYVKIFVVEPYTLSENDSSEDTSKDEE